MRLEEDKKIQKKTNTSYDYPNSNNNSSSQKYYICKPYSKTENHRVIALEYENYRKIYDCCFYVNVLSLLCAMEDLGGQSKMYQ